MLGGSQPPLQSADESAFGFDVGRECHLEAVLQRGEGPSGGEPVTADAFLHLAHDQLRVVRQRLDDGHRLLSVRQPPARHGVDRHLHYLHAQVARLDAAAE